MFMAGSRMESQDQTLQSGPIGNTIFVVAKADLFSECMIEALAKKFDSCDVVGVQNSRVILDETAPEAKLILFYRIPNTELQTTLSAFRAIRPETPVGLVVEALDAPDAHISRLVEARVIDGVLPLNLRLDVFMAAVDLLMKGGEHFPSAFLGHLSTSMNQQASLMYNSRRGEMSDDGSIKLRRDDMSSLTTREVQILDLICKGTQNKIIADKLRLSENTVKVHVRNIYKKMNVRNRTEAASRFFSNKNGIDHDSMNKWRN